MSDPQLGLLSCPACAHEVSAQAVACPNCGHQLHQQKSQATLILGLGILGLWPLFFLGPVAWLLGRGEMAAIDAGVRPGTLRRRVVLGRRLGIVGTCFWAVAIPWYFLWGDALTGPPTYRSTFEDGDAYGFVTESDNLVDLFVQDGQYRIRIKDGGPPQTLRIFDSMARPAVHFEASMSQVAESASEGLYGVGCWNSDSGYLFVISTAGEAGMIEVVRSSAGEQRVLAAPKPLDGDRRIGQPDRLRIDCMGGGTEPTLITGSVNGTPIVTVSVASGIDGFNATGFWAVVAGGELDLAVDDYIAVAERSEVSLTAVAAGGRENLAAACESLLTEFLDSTQQLMDGMTAWASFDELDAASTIDVRAVHGDVFDAFLLDVTRLVWWGCLDAAGDRLDELTISNPVAEEFLAEFAAGI